MEWLYHSKTRSLPTDGKHGGAGLQLVASLCELLGGVARMTRHSGQSTIKVSLQHDKKELLVEAIKLVSNTLCRFVLMAERWTIQQRWTLLLTHIFRHWLGGKWLGALPAGAHALYRDE